jgi:hypothetical protein
MNQQYELVLPEHADAPAHDPEKWIPVFGKDHARKRSWIGMTIRRIVIPIQKAAKDAADCP